MRTLYTGLNPPQHFNCLHCPMIKIIPRSPNDPAIKKMISIARDCTHLVFTSRPAAGLFFDSVPPSDMTGKTWIAVGKATAQCLPFDALVPEKETAEGVVELLSRLPLDDSFFLWPHSALSRAVIDNFFTKNNIKFYDCVLYDTISNIPRPLPSLNEIDEIVFTSPSTIQGFIDAYGSIPKDKVLTPIGPVTSSALHKWMNGRQ
jgi:uroporphyrinogen-III synthase